MNCLCLRCGRTVDCGDIYCAICESIIEDEADGLVDGYPSASGREERGFD
jgi:hypothetical protein